MPFRLGQQGGFCANGMICGIDAHVIFGDLDERYQERRGYSSRFTLSVPCFLEGLGEGLPVHVWVR